MDQDNKNTTGAPSNDTTSALFVSARKKQLEQQEADRRAREKEEQRLAAEAEVRRLEREVEDRRRKAEEDAKKADEDARRIAEESRQKQAQAASNPDAILGAQQEKKEIKLPSMPKMPKISAPVKQEKPAKPAGGAATATKAPMNTKMLAIIGGGVAVVVLIIVLVMTMGGGDRGGGADLPNNYISNSLGIDFSYPTGWVVEEDASLNAVLLTGDTGMLMIVDGTESINDAMDAQGGDIVSATESYFEMLLGAIGFDESNMPTPTLQKTGEYVSGGAEFELDENYLRMQVEAIEGRMIVFIHTALTEDRDEFEALAADIERSIMVDVAGAVDDGGGAAPSGSGEYSDAGYYFRYPPDWKVEDIEDDGYRKGTVMVSPNGVTEETVGDTEFVVVCDYTDSLEDWESNSQDILSVFFNELATGMSLEELLGGFSNEQLYDETTDEEYIIRQMSANFGDTTVFAHIQIDTNNERAQAAFSVGLTDDTLQAISDIVESLRSE